MSKKEIYNWGVYPKIDAEVIEVSDYNKIIHKLAPKSPIIARGNGKCYGDSSLQNRIISTLKLNKILFFDKTNGVLKCESGVLLSEIIQVIIPHGYFLSVTPGTKFITAGGAVASNIHGKNHHKDGAFSRYIIDLEIMVENGKIITCSKIKNRELFINTIGGMGLTGIITTVSFKLKKVETSYIKQKSIKACNLNQAIDYLEKYNEYTYSVAWIDCISKGKSMGRSILMLGEHAQQSEITNSKNNFLALHSSKKINIPFYFPKYILNKYSMHLFNFLYYNKQLKKVKDQIIHYDSFFYPLDSLDNWNRIYGKNGLTQYQFVIPFKNGREALNKIISKVTDSECASFLAVLKILGDNDQYSSPLSFPTKGYTLALDFKINRKVFALLDKLDDIILTYGGKLYLAKDARMSREMFKKTYPNTFKTNHFTSLQYERVIK